MTPPRAAGLVAVTVLHLAVAGVLLAQHAGRHLVLVPSAMIEIRNVPRAGIPAVASVPRAVRLRDAPRVTVMPPEVTLALSEPAPAEPSPASAPVTTTSAPDRLASAAPPPIEPPRFDAAYLRNPSPEYPAISRRIREQGRVVLRVLVSAAGDAQDLEVGSSSGSERLDRAAIDAVRRWRFTPAHRGTQAVAAWALVPIVFRLDT